MDRWRRQSVLVWSSIGRSLSLACVPVLFLFGVLSIPMLVVALLAFGTFSVFGFAATQSLLPRLVPGNELVKANARLDLTDATSMTLGPALAGVRCGGSGPRWRSPSTQSATCSKLPWCAA